MNVANIAQSKSVTLNAYVRKEGRLKINVLNTQFEEFQKALQNKHKINKRGLKEENKTDEKLVQ